MKTLLIGFLLLAMSFGSEPANAQNQPVPQNLSVGAMPNSISPRKGSTIVTQVLLSNSTIEQDLSGYTFVFTAKLLPGYQNYNVNDYIDLKQDSVQTNRAYLTLKKGGVTGVQIYVEATKEGRKVIGATPPIIIIR